MGEILNFTKPCEATQLAPESGNAIGAKRKLKMPGPLIPNLYGDAFKSIHPEEINRQVEAAMGFTNESLISYYEAMIRRPDRIDVLLTFQKPVLFIIGAEDKAVNLADSLAQCHLPEESHVHFLEKSGHMGMCEEALKTTSAIKEFLWRLNEN